MKARTTGTLTVIAFAVLGILALALFRASPVEMVYPVERANASFQRKVAARWRGLWHGVAASAENVRLKREVATLAMDRSDVEGVLAENARLRRALAFKEREKVEWEAAEVLSEGGGAAGARRTIRVGKGSLAGVKIRAVVVVPEGLVGEVVKVTPHTSEVLLVTDPSFQVSCTVQGESPVYGVVSGGGEGPLEIRHLKAGAEIAPRSKVLTSGLGGVFPAGITVGTFITESDERGAAGRLADGLEREGRVQPAVDLSLLEDVFIRK